MRRKAENEDEDDDPNPHSGAANRGDPSSSLPLSVGLKASTMMVGPHPDKGVNSVRAEDESQCWKHRLSLGSVNAG